MSEEPSSLSSSSSSSSSSPSTPTSILPPSWTNRIFCRCNTQSEPEDICHSSNSESSSEELECLRCCTDYYYMRRAGEVEESRPSTPTWSDGEDEEKEQDWKEELAEGFRLVFFIALPMLARQLGSILSRRVLSRIFGRITTWFPCKVGRSLV